MITYIYVYKDTPEEDPPEYCEIVHSIKDEPYSSHPENGRPIERSFCGTNPTILPKGTQPQTFGMIASRNTEALEKAGDPRVATGPNTIPWWRPGKKKPVDITGKTKSQILKYIKEGKI